MVTRLRSMLRAFGCLLVASPLSPLSAQTRTDPASAGPLPALDAPLVPAPAREGHWPRVLAPASHAAAPTPAQTEQWSPSQVEEARRECRELLAGVSVVALPVEPFKHGECGAPAAVQLISVGRNPEVALSPPVVVTCRMAATFARWLAGDMQALARRHLGAPVVRVDTMSGYSCRTAYGRRNARLSEHGKANAVDIRGFTTAQGLQVALLDDWGTPNRVIEARIAAAKAAAAKAEALKLAQAKAAEQKAKAAGSTAVAAAPAPGKAASGPTQPWPSATIAPTPADQSPALAIAGQSVPTPQTTARGIGFAPTLPGLRLPRAEADSASGFSLFPAPSRLGGPRAAERAPASPMQPPGKQLFLQAVHASACRSFGTVLGPEANAQHENHFHFDAAERASGNFCE